MIICILQVVGEYSNHDFTTRDGVLHIAERRTLIYYTLVFNNDGTARIAHLLVTRSKLIGSPD